MSGRAPSTMLRRVPFPHEGEETETFMLELRPNCECCDRDLPFDSAEARICTFECTFCAGCVDGTLKGVCPNCGGGFVPRPIRPARLMARYPASTKRVLKPEGCAA